MAIAVPPNFGNGCFPHCWSVTGPAGSGSPDHSRVVLATVLAPRLAAGGRGSLGQGQLLLVPINVLLYVARIIGGAVEVSSTDLQTAHRYQGRIQTQMAQITRISLLISVLSVPFVSAVSVGYRKMARETTPAPTRRMPSHWPPVGRSPRMAKARMATRTTLNLSTGATLAASPIFRARK